MKQVYIITDTVACESCNSFVSVHATRDGAIAAVGCYLAKEAPALLKQRAGDLKWGKSKNDWGGRWVEIFIEELKP